MLNMLLEYSWWEDLSPSSLIVLLGLSTRTEGFARAVLPKLLPDFFFLEPEPSLLGKLRVSLETTTFSGGAKVG